MLRVYSIAFQTLWKEKLFMYPPPLWKFVSFRPLYPLKIPCPSMGGYGYFLEPHIILSCGARRRNYQISSVFRSYFPMFSLMLFLLVKKMETMFYLVPFCPPKSIKSNFAYLIFLVFVAAQEIGMGHRQFHAGEEGQGGHFGKSYRKQMSPIGPYFQLNSPNNFSANRSVVDLNHCTWLCTWLCYVLEKHSRITCFK